MSKKILKIAGACIVAILAYSFNVSRLSVGVSVQYDLEYCGESSPLRVTVVNRSIFPIQSYGLSASAMKPGYSDTKRVEIWNVSTKIIPRWSSYSQCLSTEASFRATSGEKSVFQYQIDAHHLEERDLIWSADIYSLRF